MHRHAERRVIPYRPDQVYELVADIERYPEFLPWCVAARIRSRTPELVVADLVIGFKMIRERFTSRVELKRPERIDVTYAEGPFRHLDNHWVFRPHAQGCEIDFDVAFEFRSALLERLIGMLFDEAVRRMVAAFEKRAQALYGTGAQTVASGPR